MKWRLCFPYIGHVTNIATNFINNIEDLKKLSKVGSPSNWEEEALRHVYIKQFHCIFSM